jgi:hypothetical protein
MSENVSNTLVVTRHSLLGERKVLRYVQCSQNVAVETKDSATPCSQTNG